MNTFGQLIFLAGLACIFTAVGMFVSLDSDGSSDAASPIAFADHVDGPVDLLIVGETARATELRADILARDTADLIEAVAQVEHPREADAVIFLLSSWDALDTVPWQSELEPVYRNAKRMASDTVGVSVTRALFGRNMQFTFYNTSHFAGWGPDCYAALFLHNLQQEEGTSFLPPAGCYI
ncbi:MAG: hypothetical protein AAGJ91_17560 [Pseudomonadota bacterium]